ncbi:endocellulase [Dendrothele bispora CBS 962.96]|uniref:Endocellulase n=1 Tax=Dendrothele bispora (strain CBS 962.96) TaxID=1314807 RepID=A0A4S8MU62_DENBC|nr:endocellulase [Dendrothele bispora CBS 962.96]
MHLSTTFISTLAFVALASAQTITGPFDCVPAGNYNLCANLWGRQAGVGGQNSTLVSTNGNNVAWNTVWNWANGPNSVKSYSNVESTVAKGIQLANIKSAPTTWTWEYASQSSGIRADVAYDIWTGVPQSGTAASSASSYEIMIWLSGLGGIQPVGSPVATNITVAGHRFDLWRGPNTNWQVLSFKTAEGDINDFNVDLNEFFQYIVQNEGVASTQFVQSIQAGTEPFTGSANLVTSNYSVSIN